MFDTTFSIIDANEDEELYPYVYFNAKNTVKRILLNTMIYCSPNAYIDGICGLPFFCSYQCDVCDDWIYANQDFYHSFGTHINHNGDVDLLAVHLKCANGNIPRDVRVVMGKPTKWSFDHIQVENQITNTTATYKLNKLDMRWELTDGVDEIGLDQIIQPNDERFMNLNIDEITNDDDDVYINWIKNIELSN